MLIPLKTRDPKSRLAGALSADERAELMRTLLERVVGAVREAGVERVTVVSAEPIDGHEVWADGGLAWNDALAAATADLVHAPLVAVVSADLPLPAQRGGRRAARRDAGARHRDRARPGRRNERGRDAAAGPRPDAFRRARKRRDPRRARRARCRGRPPGPRVRRRHARRPRQDAGRMASEARLQGVGGAVPAAAAARPVRRRRSGSGSSWSGSPTTSSRSATTAVTPRRACPGWARSASAPSGHCSGRACSPRRCATTPRSSPRRSGRSPASTPGGSGWASAPASP